MRALCSGRGGYWGQELPEPPIVWPLDEDKLSRKSAPSLRRPSQKQNQNQESNGSNDNGNDDDIDDDDDVSHERVGIWAAARRNSSKGAFEGTGQKFDGDDVLLEVPFSTEAGFQLPLEGDLSISVSTECISHVTHSHRTQCNQASSASILSIFVYFM